MRLISLELESKLRDKRLWPETRVAWASLYIIALDLLFFVVQLATSRVRPGISSSLGGWVIFLSIVAIVLLAILAFRWMRANLLWRLRNRLIVTYIFSKRVEIAWIGLLVGFILPYSYASYKRNKRFERFEELFPEAIDTLARAVRAGHAFTTALEMITSEINEPIAGEFRQLYEEQKFGMPVRDALLNLTDRVPLVDVKFFVTAVMLQRETGGNLAEILDNLSYVIRERFKIQRQVRVYTAQGRLTMALLMGMPPIIVTVMLVLNPSFIQPLFSDPIGHTLLVAGITLQTIGYFVIRKIIRIQV